MKTSKTALKSLIAVAAFGAALTGMAANAQPGPQNHPMGPNHGPAAHIDNGQQLKDRVQNLRSRINEGKRFRKLSVREASRLTGRLNEIVSLQRGYERSNHGLDVRETATLNAKLDQLSADIHYQGNDGNRR